MRWLVLLAVGAGGPFDWTCGVVTTEEGQFELDDDELESDPVVEMVSGDPVVVGTRFCPDADWVVRLEDGSTHGYASAIEVIEACFDRTLEGPAVWTADGCFSFEDVGEVVWTLTRRDCQVEETEHHHVADLVDDRLRFRVIEAESTEARLEDANYRWITCALSPGNEPGFPVLEPVAAQPLRIVQDQRAWLELTLFETGSQTGVAWDRSTGRRELVGSIVTDEEGEFVAVEPGANESIEASIVLGTVERVTAGAIAVPPGDAATLEVVTGYLPYGDDPQRWAQPLLARAIVRDAEGRALYGAPIEWEVEGRGLIGSPGGGPDDEWSAEYFSFEVCPNFGDEDEAREGHVVARWGELVAEAELAWTQPAEEEPDDGDEPAAACEAGGDGGGCGCAARGENMAGCSVLVLLCAIRRRRRRVGAPGPESATT